MFPVRTVPTPAAARFTAALRKSTNDAVAWAKTEFVIRADASFVTASIDAFVEAPYLKTQWSKTDPGIWTLTPRQLPGAGAVVVPSPFVSPPMVSSRTEVKTMGLAGEPPFARILPPAASTVSPVPAANFTIAHGSMVSGALT